MSDGKSKKAGSDRMDKGVLIFSLVVAAICFCTQIKPLDTPENGEKEDLPDQEMWNSQFRVINRGRLEVIVRYGHMSRFSEKKRADFDQGVKVDFYNDEGEHASLLTSDRAELDERVNDVRAMGNVVIESDSGVTLYTEEIAYNQETDMIVSQVDVMITTTNGDTLWGTGFESDPQLDNYKILKPKGISHKGIDMSEDRWKETQDSVSVSPDSVFSTDDDSSGLKSDSAFVVPPDSVRKR
jgi:LPS export ABC transporter protein LptC